VEETRKKSSLSSVSNINFKNSKYRSGLKRSLETLGVAKPEKNSKFKFYYENLCTALAVSMDLEKAQNNANYELEVLKEHKRLLLLEKGYSGNIDMEIDNGGEKIMMDLMIMDSKPLNEADKIANQLINALPYIDDYSPEAEEMATKLIQEEMKTFAPPDYLENQPLQFPTFGSSVLLKNEWDRMVKTGDPKLPPLDISRYAAGNPPVSKIKSVESWEDALKMTKHQLLYQTNRLENLELLKLYGANAWRLHNESLNQIEQQLQNTLNELRQEIEQTNWQRKRAQTEIGNRLTQLESEWHELVFKNFEIEKACIKLEEQITALERGH